MERVKYMVLNPMHFDFYNIPKKVKVLGNNPYTAAAVAWTSNLNDDIKPIEEKSQNNLKQDI